MYQSFVYCIDFNEENVYWSGAYICRGVLWQGSTLTFFLGGPIGPLKSIIMAIFSCPNRKFSGPKKKV